MKYVVDITAAYSSDYVDAEIEFENVYEAKASFDHYTSMAIQHGELNRVEMRRANSDVVILAYDHHNLRGTL